MRGSAEQRVGGVMLTHQCNPVSLIHGPEAMPDVPEGEVLTEPKLCGNLALRNDATNRNLFQGRR